MAILFKGGSSLNLREGVLLGCMTGGAKKAVIQRFYNHPYSTISDTISNSELRDNSASLPRSGAAKSYSPAEERMILRHVRKFPKETYKQVIYACKVSCKKNTIKEDLKRAWHQELEVQETPIPYSK
jgi:hypothetical protein